MSKARHILAVVAVATVLCADHAVSAAPAPKPHMVEMAAKWVERLSQPFRRTAPSALRPLDRSRAGYAQLATPRIGEGQLSVRVCIFAPFQFRLPPPVV